MPRISICIPCFNHEKFVGAAIESSLAQTERDIEVIVFNDRSTDRSAEIVRGFQDPRVTLVDNEQRLGLVGNFNRALFGGTAEYVKILCADDYLEPECVAKLADALDRFPEAAYATSGRYMVYPGGTRKLLQPPFEEMTPIAGTELVRKSWLCFNVIGEPTTVMVRRSAVAHSGGFDPRYHQMLDWELWLRLSANSPFIHVEDALSSFLWHEENESVLKGDSAWAAYDLLRLSQEVVTRRERYPTVSFSQRKRLQVLCAGRALLGMASTAARRNWNAFRSCAELFANALASIFGGRPELAKLPFFARN